MLTFSVNTLWMAIYSIVGPNIWQVSVHVNALIDWLLLIYRSVIINIYILVIINI